MRHKELADFVSLEVIEGGAEDSPERYALAPSEKDQYVDQLREVAQGIFLDFKKTLGAGKPVNASLMGVYHRIILDLVERLERVEGNGEASGDELDRLTLEGLRQLYARVQPKERKD